MCRLPLAGRARAQDARETDPLPQAMSKNLSWSEQLDALLSATDGNVARIKVRGSKPRGLGVWIKELRQISLNMHVFLL